MKMNRIRWIKRVLVCGVILCLAGTSAGFRTQPALAGSKDEIHKVLIVLFKQPENTMCLHQTAVVDGVYVVNTPYAPDSEKLHPVSLLPPGQGEMIVSARGKLSLKKFSSSKVLIDKVEPFKFTYEATQLGTDTITMEVNINYGHNYKLSVKRELPIKVVSCTFKVHGTTDVGAGMNSMMPEPGWEYVGTYDMFGTVSLEEDGIHGEGVASTFQVFLWTGEADVDGSCVQEPPWEGAAAMEIVADPSAFADSGMLNLEFFVESMPINASQITCADAEGGSGWSPIPASTTSAYSFFSGPIPADGGHITIFEGPFQTDLILSQERDS